MTQRSEKMKKALAKLDPDPIKIDTITNIRFYPGVKTHFEAKAVIIDKSLQDKLILAIKTGKYCSILWQDKTYLGIVNSISADGYFSFEVTFVGYL